MRFLFTGDDPTIRSTFGTLGPRLTHTDLGGGLFIVHLDSNEPHLVNQIAQIPGASMFPAHSRQVTSHHVTLLGPGYGVTQGDTVNSALDKIHAITPSMLTDSTLPIY